jgi:hypothetical protein
MELTLVDASNPIREWMERARSTVQLELDEESPDTDAPIPSAMVTATAHPRDLQYRTGSSSVLEWVWKNIGGSNRRKKEDICYTTYKAQQKTEGQNSHI